jgi:biopolymer transport protein ExbD
MKIPRRTPGRGVGFDMTPMIDIVFQLIIFFLVSSHLTKQEAHTKLPLPTATSGEASHDESAPRVTLNVQANGSITLGSAAVSLAALPEKLKAKRALVGDGLEVRIRSDRHVPYRVISPLLSACAAADVWNVTFAVYRPEDARR